MRCKKNQPSNLGSSETIREAPQKMKLDDYEKFGKPTHLKKGDRPFLEWFIGFSEGDGSFVLTKPAFIINQKDPKLMFRIKKKLGFGSVYKTSQPGIWRYSVTGQKNCLRLYYLFNGNLVLTKSRARFGQWCSQLQPKRQPSTKGTQSTRNITLTNGWLSGFIEAEGGFYARVRKKTQTKTGFQFQKKFYITQKGEKEVLQRILVLLGSHATIQTWNQTQYLPLSRQHLMTYRIEICAFQSHLTLLNYLEKFPNFGEKNISICIWRKMHQNQVKQNHLTNSGLRQLSKLCVRLNRQNKRPQKE